MWGDGRHPRTRQNNQQLGMLARELHSHVWKPDRTRSTLAGKTKTQKRNLDLGCHNCQHLLTDKGATGRSQRRQATTKILNSDRVFKLVQLCGATSLENQQTSLMTHAAHKQTTCKNHQPVLPKPCPRT